VLREQLVAYCTLHFTGSHTPRLRLWTSTVSLLPSVKTRHGHKIEAQCDRPQSPRPLHHASAKLQARICKGLLSGKHCSAVDACFQNPWINNILSALLPPPPPPPELSCQVAFAASFSGIGLLLTWRHGHVGRRPNRWRAP